MGSSRVLAFFGHDGLLGDPFTCLSLDPASPLFLFGSCLQKSFWAFLLVVNTSQTLPQRFPPKVPPGVSPGGPPKVPPVLFPRVSPRGLRQRFPQGFPQSFPQGTPPEGASASCKAPPPPATALAAPLNH